MRVLLISKRTLVIAVVALIIVIVAVLLAFGSVDEGADSAAAMSGAAGLNENYELEVLAGRQKELPVYSVQRSDKKIALTIDAAWEDDKTPFILDELKKNNIVATFYLCGFWADKYPENVKAIAAGGHELGNHSATHPHMNSLSPEKMREELKKFDDNMEKLVGKRCKTFRAPYGEYNDSVIKTVREMGYVPVQWSIDTIDWKEERSADTILNTVIPKLAPGCIILCHNNGFKIKEYLPVLISKAKEQGYEFVTVSELLLSGNTMIDVNGMQKPA